MNEVISDMDFPIPNKPPDPETLLRILIDLYLEQEGIEAEYEIVDAPA